MQEEDKELFESGRAAQKAGPFVSSPEQIAPITVPSARILVMDDEEVIRLLLREILEQMDYEVMVSREGAEAVARYKEALAAARPFQAVIMDLNVLNGMGGQKAARLLLELDPLAILILCSGYSNDPVLLNYRDYGFKGVLIKPYKINEMQRLLKSLLAAKAP